MKRYRDFLYDLSTHWIILVAFLALVRECFITAGQPHHCTNEKVYVQHHIMRQSVYFTNFYESLHSAGHCEFFTMRWSRLLGDCVLRQAPSFLHHQFLIEQKDK